MTALSLYFQIGLSLVMARVAWQLLRGRLLAQESEPSAPLASKLAHGLFVLALALPLLVLAVPEVAPEAAVAGQEASDQAATASPTSASGFTLLGREATAAIPPELLAALPLPACALLLPFVVVAAWRTASQWLWLRGVIARAESVRRCGRVRVLVSGEVDTPFSTSALGLAHVVLPSSLALSGTDRRLVLRHELHHHRRRDVQWALALDALRVVFAWNPSMGSWARELSDWQERACDAQLIERGAPLRAYAGCLLRVAEHELSSPLPIASAAMARPNGRCALKRRIEMLIDTKTRSHRLGARSGALALGLATILTTSTWAVAATLPQAVTTPPQAVAASVAVPAPVPSPQKAGIAIGSLAPDVTLGDGRGERTSLKDLRGQVVVMEFWADWCRFCNDAAPALRELETQLDDSGLAVVGVSVDKDRAAFDRFLVKHDLDWPQHHGKDGMAGDVAQAYGVRALPLHVVIDREGRIAASGVQVAQLRPTIEALLDRGELSTLR